jgi:hypothetical protein
MLAASLACVLATGCGSSNKQVSQAPKVTSTPAAPAATSHPATTTPTARAEQKPALTTAQRAALASLGQQLNAADASLSSGNGAIADVNASQSEEGTVP